LPDEDFTESKSLGKPELRVSTVIKLKKPGKKNPGLFLSHKPYLSDKTL
jgi:hypothetical protein